MSETRPCLQCIEIPSAVEKIWFYFTITKRCCIHEKFLRITELSKLPYFAYNEVRQNYCKTFAVCKNLLVRYYSCSFMDICCHFKCYTGVLLMSFCLQQKLNFLLNVDKYKKCRKCVNITRPIAVDQIC